jgi:hypothetical protein
VTAAEADIRHHSEHASHVNCTLKSVLVTSASSLQGLGKTGCVAYMPTFLYKGSCHRLRGAAWLQEPIHNGGVGGSSRALLHASNKSSSVPSADPDSSAGSTAAAATAAVHIFAGQRCHSRVTVIRAKPVIVPWSSSALNVWDQPATIAAASCRYRACTACCATVLTKRRTCKLVKQSGFYKRQNAILVGGYAQDRCGTGLLLLGSSLVRLAAGVKSSTNSLNER